MFRKKAGAWPVFLVLALLLSLLVLPAQAAEEAIGVTINGTPVTYDDGYGRPFVDAAGRTQVPFRLTMETFGCSVDWDNDTRTAVAEKDGTKVEVPVGRDYLIINGKRADIDTTAQLVDGRVYLPIRPVLEAFDASVTWNSKDHLVVVTTGSSLVRVYFLDVGQGDATLIDCGETEVLIDGGTNSAGKDVVAAIAPYIDGKLDYVIATHPDADHVGGLDAVLAAFEVGEVIDSGFIPYPDGFTLPPHSENALPLAVHIPDKGKCFLKIFYHCKKDLPLRSEDHLLGFDEILLENEDSRNQKTLAMWSDAPSNSTITVQETDRHLTLRGKNFTYNFNKLTGLFAAMQYEDAVLLDKEMEFNIWRAPTDNDRKLKLDWLAARYDHCMTNAYRTEYQVTDSGVTLRAKVGIAPISLQKFLDLDVCWTISNSGAVTLALHAERNTVFPELPRFGLRLFLPKEMARVSYFGMGPMESYCDKHHAASHDYFSSTIWQQHEDYIRPQENGSHYDCDYVQLDGAGIKLTAVGAKPFCFNASHYTQEELTEKAHNYELHPCDSTVLCLDYAQNGIGSASCGPRLAEQYRLDDASFDFSIRLIPEKA